MKQLTIFLAVTLITTSSSLAMSCEHLLRMDPDTEVASTITFKNTTTDAWLYINEDEDLAVCPNTEKSTSETVKTVLARAPGNIFVSHIIRGLMTGPVQSITLSKDEEYSLIIDFLPYRRKTPQEQ